MLDCRVYNLALMEHLGISSMTRDDWAGLVKDRGAAELEPSLFTAAASPKHVDPAAAELDRLMRDNMDLWT